MDLTELWCELDDADSKHERVLHNRAVGAGETVVLDCKQ